MHNESSIWIEKAEDYIFQTFQDCNIIGIGEGAHGLENSHHFFRSLFDNKTIQQTINILILEFANVDHQDVLDKYIIGENVNINELQKVWRESTQSPGLFGELPVYLELLQKIRDVNLTLPKDKKIRVLAGDPSIDWNAINTRDDYIQSLACRQTFPAQLAIDYGINQNQKVLLIYAGFHLAKFTDKNLATHQTITSIVNKKLPHAMKVIEVLNPEIFQLEKETKSWPLYSIIDLSTNEIGNFPAEKIFSTIFNKNVEKLKVFEGYKVKDLFDAFLYVGPSDSWKICEASKPDFNDEEWNELNRRRQIIGLGPLEDR